MGKRTADCWAASRDDKRAAPRELQKVDQLVAERETLTVESSAARMAK